MTFMGNTGFRFPFVHYPTCDTSPGALMFAFWRSVQWLLLAGFDTIYCCVDGSECNRSFIKLHFKNKDPQAQLFTTDNPFTGNPFIFVMDPEVIYYKMQVLFRLTYQEGTWQLCFFKIKIQTHKAVSKRFQSSKIYVTNLFHIKQMCNSVQLFYCMKILWHENFAVILISWFFGQNCISGYFNFAVGAYNYISRHSTENFKK